LQEKLILTFLKGLQNTVEANNNRLSVFPNPTNDLLNVDLTDFIQSNVQLSIIDMRGRVVYQQILNNQTKKISVFKQTEASKMQFENLSYSEKAYYDAIKEI
jgi:hypothetical protein